MLFVVAAVVGFADAEWWFYWLAFLSWLACAIVSVAKGKWRVALVDVFLWLLSYVAAFRLAKPHSLWARKLYDRAKMHRALVRYGGPPSRFELEEMSG